MPVTRRRILAYLAAAPVPALVPALVLATPLVAQNRDIWSAAQAHDALSRDKIRMLDIRTPREWADTGVAKGAWPVNLHDKRFGKWLFTAQDLANGRPVALICAVGGRTGGVMGYLRQSKYDGFIDVSEGMMGSRAGPGWIKSGLPIVTDTAALAALPDALKS